MDEIETIVFGRKMADAKASDEEPNDVPEEDPYAAEEEVTAVDLQGKPPNPTGPGSEESRQEGQKRADEREMVRRAARRAVVFGFSIEEAEAIPKNTKVKSHIEKAKSADEAPRRKCEAVMSGNVVEPSFAKGNWSIRWRE